MVRQNYYYSIILSIIVQFTFRSGTIHAVETSKLHGSISSGYIVQNQLMHGVFRGIAMDLKINYTLYKVINIEYNIETAYLCHKFWLEDMSGNSSVEWIYRHDQVLYTGLHFKLLGTKYNVQSYWNIGASLRLYLWSYKKDWSWLKYPFFPIFETSFGLRFNLTESLYWRSGLDLGASLETKYARFSFLSKIDIGIGIRF